MSLAGISLRDARSGSFQANGSDQPIHTRRDKKNMLLSEPELPRARAMRKIWTRVDTITQMGFGWSVYVPSPKPTETPQERTNNDNQ